MTLIWTPVTAASRTNAHHRDFAAGTLGALLYADSARVRVPEKDWVALVQAIAQRDQGALQALYERAHRIVFTLVMRMTRSRETADELTLDVFHDVWQRAAAYDPEDGSVIGWIMNQARSRTIDRLRFEQRKKRRPAEAGVPPASSDAPELLDFRDDGQLLHKALGVLTTAERQAIETAFFSGLTHAEAAALLNQPIGTVKTRIRSGLAKLREALAPGDEP
jgi:RNA polymerase sigma-70 factor (ECF subfamily)